MEEDAKKISEGRDSRHGSRHDKVLEDQKQQGGQCEGQSQRGALVGERSEREGARPGHQGL